MKLLILDFESFFSQEYQLRNSTTEAYIRDQRFSAHMLGYYAPDQMAAPGECLPHLLHDRQDLRDWIETSAVVAHHAQFDGLILSHHYDLRPKFWFDTLAMARLALPRLKSHSLDSLATYFGLPQKIVPYNLFKGVRDLSPELYVQVADGCKHDVWLTHQILLKLLPFVPAEELKCIDSTIRMFTEPVLQLDRPRMQAFLQAERLRKAKAMITAGKSLGLELAASASPEDAKTLPSRLRDLLVAIEIQLQSADKFRTALEAIGYPCPMKWSEKQKCEIPALAKNDDGMQDLLEHPDSRVSALAAARLGVKSTIDETRAERLLDIDTRGAIPMYIAPYATKTLRVGGGDKNNVLNWRRGGEIRKSIKAPPGHKLVIGDESQIEYRMLCWLTGQRDKLEALVAGRDLYCEFASTFYGETITKEDKPRRGVGKQGILMSGYGAGAGTLIATAAGGGYGPPVYLTQEEGLRMRDLFRSSHPHVPEFWRWCDAALPILSSGGTTSYKDVLHIEDHKIWFPNDTAMDYTGLKWASNVQIFPDQEDDGEGPAWWEPTRKGWGRIWGSKLTADIVQGLARVLIARAMALVAPRYRLVLQVYDELVACVPDEQAQEAEAFMLSVLKSAPPWCADLPLDAESIVSQSYDK